MENPRDKTPDTGRRPGGAFSCFLAVVKGFVRFLGTNSGSILCSRSASENMLPALG